MPPTDSRKKALVCLALLMLSVGCEKRPAPRAAKAPASAPSAPTVQWRYQATDAVEATPATAEGVVYVADTAGTLHAIDLNAGTGKWTYSAEGGFAATPTVDAGLVMLGDLDGVFHAVGANDGHLRWSFDSGSAIHASARAVGGRVIFPNDAGKVFCLKVADGQQLWTYSAGDRINAAAAIGSALAVFAGCDAKMYGIALTDGTELFNVDIDALTGGSPLLLDDRIIVGTAGGLVCGYDLTTLKKLWTYDRIEDGAMVIASPVEADGVVVVGARDAVVHAIAAADGKRVWNFRTGGDIDGPAVIVGRRVYVTSADERLYVLSLDTGRLLWSFPAGKPLIAGPALAQGRILIADDGGTVYCLTE
ncbi:MAG: PQQ-binding-like beta-propeller repeat protein [Planctomycetes bacterium]|nr:PQQ-binding-like beta-propeller repeat protein [Planctomycetota bacterium]